VSHLPRPDAHGVALRHNIRRELKKLGNGGARIALHAIAKRCECAEDAVVDLVAEFLGWRDALAWRLAHSRQDRLMANNLRSAVDWLERDQIEAAILRSVFAIDRSPPGPDVIASLDQARAYFETRLLPDVIAKEKAFLGLTRKATPERIAAGMVASEIELLANAPLDALVIDLLAPFMENSFKDRMELRRARDSYKIALHAAHSRIHVIDSTK
jgi:hypothetical protein